MIYRLLFTALILIPAWTTFAQPADRPNVVLVMTDDQGYGDLSLHGNPILKTPNMDRLGETSIRFTDFFGDQKQRVPVADGDMEATLRVALPAGRMDLQTWFTTAEGDEFGAHYVYVRRLHSP